MNPFVSIIVPVYNVEDFVWRCLESIAGQTHTNFECIIVDDGSTDRSGEACEKFCLQDSRFRVMHQENKGLGPARNAGMDIAKGDYLWFVDSDDVVSGDCLRTAVDMILSGPYDIAVFGFVEVPFDTVPAPTGGGKSNSETYVLDGTDAVKKMLFGKSGYESLCFILCWNKLYSRTFLGDLKQHDIYGGEDIEYNFRVYQNNPAIVFSDRRMYYWFRRRTSISFLDRDKAVYNAFAGFCTLEEYASKENAETRALYLKKLYHRIWTGEWAANNPDYRLRFKQLRDAVVSKTWKEFLLHPRIGLKEKIQFLFLWAFPLVGCRVYKAKDN